MSHATESPTTLDRTLAAFAAAPIGGYHPDGEPASEPIAWATIALARAAHSGARVGAEWLADRQTASGSVGVTESQEEPGWPTALAMLAWGRIDPEGYADHIARGAAWALAQDPWSSPRHKNFGHDTSLAGWSWAPDTHSWLEPTAFFSVALRECGHADHPRRLEAVRLLTDRLLPSGGANYGNTTVFGQELLQHVQSSGVVLWALAGEPIDDPRIGRAIGYLTSVINEPTGVASLAWAARGLAAWGRGEVAREPLKDAAERAIASGSLHKLALVTLAIQEATKHAASLASR